MQADADDDDRRQGQNAGVWWSDVEECKVEMERRLSVIDTGTNKARVRLSKTLRRRWLKTHPRDVVDIGLKSVRPDSTKCWRTVGQSSRVSQEILLGGSTSTGMT
jgi:hypothetical protein